jgi:hypothetical protein
VETNEVKRRMMSYNQYMGERQKPQNSSDKVHAEGAEELQRNEM